MNTIPAVPGSARKVLSSRAWTPTSTPIDTPVFRTPLLRPVPAPPRPFHIDIGQEIYIERRDGKIHLASVKEIDHANNRVTVVFWETEQLRTKSVDMYRVLELNSWIPARPKASPITSSSCNPTPNVNPNQTPNHPISFPLSHASMPSSQSQIFGSVKKTPQVSRTGTVSSCENNNGKTVDPLRTPFKNLANVQNKLNNQENVPKTANNAPVNSVKKSKLFSPPPPPRRPASSCSSTKIGISNTPAPTQYYVSSSSTESSSVLTFPLTDSNPIQNHEIEVEKEIKPEEKEEAVLLKNEKHVEPEVKTEISGVSIGHSPELSSVSASSASFSSSSSSSPSFFRGRGEQTSAWTNTNTNFSTASPSIWSIHPAPLSKSKISNTPMQVEKAAVEENETNANSNNNNADQVNSSTLDVNSKKAEERKNRMEKMMPVDREGYDNRPIRARYYEAGEKYEVAVLEEMLQEEIQFCRDMTKTLVGTIMKLEEEVKEKEDIILRLEAKVKTLELAQSQSYFKNQNNGNINHQNLDKSPTKPNNSYHNDERVGSSPEFLDASCFFQD